MKTSLSVTLAVAVACMWAQTHAQAPGVPVYTDGQGRRAEAPLIKQAKELKDAGGLLSMTQVAEQAKRSVCELALPKAQSQQLNGRELWNRSRKAHLRVGWLFLCKDCNRWHLNLAGGYAITNSAAATCAHVLDPLDMREGYLIAVDEEERVLPVAEVLAVNRVLDSAILRLKTGTLQPLPLSTNVAPGDTVSCFSDPMGRRGFFSQGIVNAFVKKPFLRKRELAALPSPPAADEAPVWVVVSTDWAPGSSGSAVVDACGNAVGHVSVIEPVLEDPPKNPKLASPPRGTMIVFHDAISASNLLALIKPPTKHP
ncbi:MAG: S1 family peptidase [Roseimicrobium sp.]